MSLRLRREIGFWTLLILGIVLNTFQVYKYVTNQLDFTTGEVIVCVVGVSFNLFPKYILNLFEKVVIKKTNKDG